MSAVVQVTILGDDASLKSTLASSEASLATFSKAAKAAGDNMQSVGRTLTHGVTVPVVAALGGAVKAAYDYQTALAKTVALSGGFGESQAKLSSQIMAVSNATGVSATSLANALYPVQSSLKDTAASLSVLNEAAKMSASGMGDAATTADALTSVINVYGVKNMSASKAADIFTATVANSKFQIADLASSIGRVLPVAANAGIGFQALGGDLAALSHSGLSADQSVTGLTALISNMIQATRNTGNAQKELSALGLSAKSLIQDMQTNGATSALDEIITKIKASGTGAQYSQAQWVELSNEMGMSLDDVKKKFQGMDLGALQKIFPNKKALLSVLGLTDATDQAAQEAGAQVANNFAGGLDKAFATVSATPAFKIHQAFTQIENDAIKIGAKVLPELASALQNALKWWNGLSDSTQNTIEHLLLVAATIGPTLLVVGKLTSGVGALGKVMDGPWWAKAIAAFALLYENSKTFRDMVNGLASALTPLTKHADLLNAALYTMGTYMVVSKFTLMFGALATWVTKLGEVKGAVEGVTVAEGAMDAASLGPIGALAALAVGAGYVSYHMTDWLLGSGSPKNASAQAKDMVNQLQGTAQALRDTQGPITGADTNLQHIALTLAAGAKTMTGTGDTAVALGKLLTQSLGLSAADAKQALEDMGYSAQDAQTILNGFSSASIDGQLDNIVSHANAANAALANAQAASIAAGVGGGGIGTAGWDQSAAGITATLTANNDPSVVAASTANATPSGAGGSGGGGSSAAGAKAAAKKAATAAKLAAAEALAATNGKPLLDMESWLMGGLQNTGKDGPVTKAAKALAADIKKNYTVKGGTVPQAATDAMNALNNLAQEASSFNTSFQTKLTSGADFVSVFKGTGAGAGDIKAYLAQQISGITRLGSDLKILAGKGVPPSILQMLANAGVDGVDQADSLVNASSADLAQIIADGNQIQSLSQGIANFTEGAIFKPPTSMTPAMAAGKTTTTKKDKKGHTINVTVNNPHAKAIAKAVGEALNSAS